MVAGALGGFAFTVWTGNPWLGALGGGDMRGADFTYSCLSGYLSRR